MALPGMGTCTLAGLYAGWLPSGNSSTEKLQHPPKPQPPPTPRRALPQHPVQAPPDLLHTAGSAFDLLVPPGMSRSCHVHPGRALCTVLVGERCLLNRKTPGSGKTDPPKQTPAMPCHSTQCRLHHNFCTLQRLHLTFQYRMACPGLATHTLAGLCALWLPSGGASSTEKLQKATNRNAHKQPAQPGNSTQCRPHHTCFILQKLHLTFQCTMASPGPATHTLARLCTLWLLSCAYSTEKLQKAAKPQPPHTT